MNFVFRMAWREGRSAWSKFIFFLLSIAIGVGALAGVKGFAASLLTAMHSQARSLMAADLSLGFSQRPTVGQLAGIERVRNTGWPLTAVTSLDTMTTSPQSEAGSLVELKAVEPGQYPYYGVLVADQGDPAALLAAGQALVAPELLDRLSIKVGDSLVIGKVTVPIGAALIKEPDRAVASFSLGPRVMIAQDVLAKAELTGAGARARDIYLVKLPEGTDIAQARRAILRVAGGNQRGVRVTDYREAQPTVQRMLERMSEFLSLVALLSLLVGGLGVANTIRVFLEQKRHNIAVMKCLGATGRQVMAVYLTQALGLGVVGSLLGVGVGLGVQAVLPRFIGPLLQLDAPLTIEYGPALQGLLVGILVALAFSLLPLWSARRVKPSVLLRRELDAPRGGLLRRGAAALLVALGIGLLFGGFAAWLADSVRYGFAFIAGLWVTLGVLGAVAWAVLRVIRRLPPPRRLIFKHGLHNLYRPGAQSTSVVMAVGTGVAVTLCVYLLQANLLTEIRNSMPANTPNMIFINLQRNQAADFTRFLRGAPGVIVAPDPLVLAQSRIATVDGKPVQVGANAQTNFTLTISDHLPEGQILVQGKWWEAPPTGGDPYLSVEERSAAALGIKMGSVVTFSIGERSLRARVVNVRHGEQPGPEGAFQMVLSKGALDAFPVQYAATAKVAPESVGTVTRLSAEQFPGVSVIDIGVIMTTVQDILNRVGLIIRFLASFAIVAGLIILAGSIAATKFRRLRESAVLKVLGATRPTVAAIFAVEYGVIGLVAGVVGSVAASLAAAALLRWVLEAGFFFRLTPLLVGLVGTGLLTVFTGFASSLDLLNRKPLAVLRDE